jgi:hypothetical protein
MLYCFHYGRAEILKLLRFIDWLIRLPRALEQALPEKLSESEVGRQLPYVERFVWEEGLQRGEARILYTTDLGKVRTVIARSDGPHQGADLPQLDQWLERILTAATPDDAFHPH